MPEPSTIVFLYTVSSPDISAPHAVVYAPTLVMPRAAMFAAAVAMAPA
jgi:hypothetical protein